ncbi:hypothetical protein ILYODFUR_027184 [Ilyodon furcidens]|uniref:Uncharacterized protein n=1 Tax=Ilyodon furcidens TaxID=33524 RepID=A0ABV0V6H8_9TELE
MYTVKRISLVRASFPSRVANKAFDQSFLYSQCHVEARALRVLLVTSDSCQRISKTDVNDAIFSQQKTEKSEQSCKQFNHPAELFQPPFGISRSELAVDAFLWQQFVIEGVEQPAAETLTQTLVPN